MIHQYINNGYHIVLDVNSGSVHSVDALLYDAVEVLAKIVPDMEKPMSLTDDQKKAVREALVCKYSAEDIEDALSDIQELIDAEELFAADIYKDYVIDFKKRQTVVKALCLHIAHDCNLACKYCFAEEGEYHGRRALMSFEVGKKALDFPKMNELVESIIENGLLSRIIVSPVTGGKYRIIAGHNRVEACRRAGFTAVPSIVKNVDENRAKLIMADTNLCQRTELLPSERAFAYKAQQEALTALGSRRATKNIAEKYGEAKRTIQRYIACTRLVPELMEMLDSGRLTLATACQFSALPNSSQEEIAAYLSRDPERKFTVEQSNTLADLKFFSESDITEICGENTTAAESPAERSESAKSSAPAEPKQTVKKPSKQITLRRKEVTQLIGDELSNEEISEYFYFCLQRRDILEEWHKMYTEGKTDGSNA